MYAPDDLVEISTRRSGIRNRQTDNLLGVNNKHGADLYVEIKY